MRSGTFTRFSKAAVVAVAGVVLGVGPSLSAGTSIAVSGDSKPSECGTANSASYAIEMSGSLVGCWSAFVAHFNCQEMNGFSLYTEIGREAFDGTLDGEAVKFDTQYTFSGIFPSGSCPEPSAEKEIAGGCIHYISGDGLVGVMRFYDVVYGDGAPHFFYEGTLAKS
jgi:hypothetical protein